MRELGFSFPVALSALGQGTSFIVAFCVCNVFKLVPPADTVDSRFFLTRICPLGAAQAGATAFSNMAYLYLTVSSRQGSQRLCIAHVGSSTTSQLA